ncbi:class I SAM-dependent methyltransferase, partial [Salmonella enterica subsp. enterica serovar Weltevreden]|nr:class I SAM-dependent methyltransferase [Salmonella enterica subsp. enterica serovar Weltevreden]
QDFFASAGLELYHEKNHELSSQPGDELKKNLLSYITAENEYTRQLDETTQNAFYERFLAIREPLNDQRDYQGVTIQLWRKK